jgi:hypothetical protein
VLWRRSSQALMLLPPGVDDVVTVAGPGIAVWELLDTWRSVDALTELLSSRYLAQEAVIRADVEALVERLERLGALETAADSGHPSSG